MYSSTHLLLPLLFTTFASVYASHQCYSCASNPNANYYQQRIAALNINNVPKASVDCIINPLNIENSEVRCEGSCFKWQSTQIEQSGGVTFNVLRGCYTTLVNSDENPSPSGGGCQYSSFETTERIVECWCSDDESNQNRLNKLRSSGG
uniref:Uncharacterized protein n=1 Tax=Plectus sambesii TaxID=2011161 RepID=A0A914W5L0_9BILA